MKDVMLISLVEAAESPESIEQDVTLIVGGFLVSGFVVSYEKYLIHLQASPEKKQELKQLKASVVNEPSEKIYNFIHLRDAKFYHPAGNPIPLNTGVYVRISLEAIHGFIPGKL